MNTDIILEKGKEIQILIKSSKLFENIPKQYHDHCIIGLIVFLIVVLPFLISLIFKGKNKSIKSNIKTKSSIKSPNKQQTPNKTPNKQTPNKQTPNKTPNKQQTPNKQKTPTPNKKHQQEQKSNKYEYPEQTEEYDENEETSKSPIKLETKQSKKSTKTPSKSKLFVFSPPKNQTRERVPPQRYLDQQSIQPVTSTRRKSTVGKK